jgi:hypothetical protein
MKVARPIIQIVALAMMASLAGPVAAQQAREFGNWRVHYNALNTRFLTPEVASAYGIQRSGSQAMLNITVVKKPASDDAMATPVAAAVEASAVNLTGQRRDIELREVRDQDAIYYIGAFRIHDQETLQFSVSVKPEGHDGPAETFEFQQQFFTE